jgi:putative drug exporter of the RND superfamily
MPGLARWCFRHRLVVVGAGPDALIVAGSAAKASYNRSFVVPGTRSARAIVLMRQLEPGASGTRTRSYGRCPAVPSASLA